MLKRTVPGYGAVATSEDAVVGINFLHAGQISSLRVRPGQTVKAGEPLIELTTDPAATLSYQTAVAALNFARRDLARITTLLAQHLATNAQLAAAQRAVDDATAAVEAQRKLGNDRKTEMVTAPFDGYVTTLTAALGDRVQPNTTVLKLARGDRVRVTVGLEPEDAARVRAGMSAAIAPVYPRPPPPGRRRARRHRHHKPDDKARRRVGRACRRSAGAAAGRREMSSPLAMSPPCGPRRRPNGSA